MREDSHRRRVGQRRRLGRRTFGPVDMADRAAGSLLGLAVGDALGSPFEGLRAHQISGPLPPFQPWGASGASQATELARLLATSLVAGKGFDAEDLAARHLAWFRSDPRGVDSLTRAVLARVATGQPAFAAARAAWEQRGPEVSAGNGAVMSCPPLGAAYAARRP